MRDLSYSFCTPSHNTPHANFDVSVEYTGWHETPGFRRSLKLQAKIHTKHTSISSSIIFTVLNQWICFRHRFFTVSQSLIMGPPYVNSLLCVITACHWPCSSDSYTYLFIQCQWRRPSAAIVMFFFCDFGAVCRRSDLLTYYTKAAHKRQDSCRADSDTTDNAGRK